MDKEQALQIAEKYAEIVAKEFHPKQILLFGSYYNGTPHEYSDIDIAVICDKYEGPGDWWDGATRLVGICWYAGMWTHLSNPIYWSSPTTRGDLRIRFRLREKSCTRKNNGGILPAKNIVSIRLWMGLQGLLAGGCRKKLFFACVFVTKIVYYRRR
jgi:hypothetical protein